MKSVSRILGSACIAVALVLFTGASANAADINYGDFSGATVNFLQVTEGSSTDPVPLYNAPAITGDTIEFSPTSFGSHSPNPNGSSDSTDGFLRFVIQAKPGFFIESISLEEFGDFTLAALDGAGALANVTGQIFGTDNVSNSQINQGFVGQRSDTLAFGPFVFIGPGAVPATRWDASAALDYTGQGVTSVLIELDNILLTATDPGASALIVKKGLDINVATTVVPEPGTLALATCGLVMIVGTRWRHRPA